MQPIPDEDLKFFATLHFTEGRKIDGLQCKLYLPKTVRERPRLITILDYEQWYKLHFARSFRFEGLAGEGAGSTRISAATAHLGEGQQRHWSHDRLTEGYRVIHPDTLVLVRELSEQRSHPLIAFQLTESLLLSPFDQRRMQLDGSIEVEKAEAIEFALTPECTLRFENTYRWTYEDDYRTVAQRELSASGGLELFPSDADPGELLSPLDDLLLLLSLAEGRRCACMSAMWHRDGTHTTLYRLNRSVPPKLLRHSLNDALISEGFEAFLRSGYDRLQQSRRPDLLRQALSAMTSPEDITVTTKFLRSFSALEALVLMYRKESDLEFVIGNASQRKALEKDLKTFMKTHAMLRDDKTSRGLISENLAGLTRVSLRHAAEKLIAEYGIRVDDLWPLFDNSEGPSLSTIRNRLVHGDLFTDKEILLHVSGAEISLTTIVYRLLLTALGWDYQESRARWSDRRQQEWRKARADLANG